MSTAKTSKNETPAKEQVVDQNTDSNRIIKNPVVTEKSYKLFQNNQYTFVVSTDANKTEIGRAIEDLYDVKVADVRVSRMKPQQTFVRGKKGQTSGYKKAVVSLRDGYSINL